MFHHAPLMQGPCRSLVFLAVLVVAGCGGPDPGDRGPARPGATLFEGATVIVGDGSAPIENAAFIVEDGRFTEVGLAGDIELPQGAAGVDLTGLTVMPALVNTHVHLGETREELTDQLEGFAYYGVGTVQSLGLDSAQVNLEMRGESVPSGARYLTSFGGITSPEPGRSEAPYWVTTEEEAREAVRDLASRGVELVKIWVDDRNGQYEKLRPELYRAIIDEAHANDQRVAAHIYFLEDAKELLRAGVDAFAHSVRDVEIDDEGLELFRASDVVLMPNLPGRDSDGFAVQSRNLELLNEAGVRIAMGTDGGSPPAAHQEMADMVAAGMTPAEVLVAATSTSADFLGLSDVGAIVEGNVADFLVLYESPLEDITNTQEIQSVYLRGEQVDREAIGASSN